MADSSAAIHPAAYGEVRTRDLLQLVALSGVAVGAGAIAWPLVELMNPSRDVLVAKLIEPQLDSARVKPGHDQWIIPVGICTHLGGVPLGNNPADPRGQWGGWFCPCHGGQYDTSGRARHGPAPANLNLPPYAFESDTKIKVG